MKRCTWDTPNKMHFESDFKTFNKQTNLISTGNVWASTQYSSYVRPYNEVKNGAYIGKPGDFLRYDMQYFRHVPERINAILRDTERNESYILYEFFIRQRGEREIVGHILTDYNHNLITYSISCPYGSSYWKRESAIRECMQYVCN